MTVQHLHDLFANRTPTPMDTTVQYAVLVPLVEQAGEFHLLYEVRAAGMRRQPGEVCFPGGRMEPGESAQACALRETFEELSIPESAIRVLGPLDFLCHRSGFVMYPVLAVVDAHAVEQMVPNPAEVDKTFLIPLSTLRTMPPEEYRYEMIPNPGADFPYERIGIPRTYPWQPGVETGPIYPWQDKSVWGLTGRITRNLLRLLDEGGL